MDNIEQINSFFDLPYRKTFEEVNEEKLVFEKEEVLVDILESFPEMVFVLNEFRQIIVWNSKVEKFINENEKSLIISKRFGELLKCIHSDVMESGCGTSEFCQECGAANAIKASREKNKGINEECRITSTLRGVEVSYDFEVHAKPFKTNNKSYTILALKDISNEKRRQILERVFFHDVLNSTGAINGLANILKEAENQDEVNELADALIDSSNQLLGEILSQRELRNAEEGNLQLSVKKETANSIIRHAYNFYKRNELSKILTFEIILLDQDVELYTDSVLLIRSISNLLKNALEASLKGDTVKIFISTIDDDIMFKVYNNKVIPLNIQKQIFKRSFSTKEGEGRGIGTYSVKLLVEQYLQGKAYFESAEDIGTTFTIQIPKYIEAEDL